MKPENWIRWDLLSENDIKTQWYLSQFPDKARALGFFLHIVCKMYQSDDGKLEQSEIFFEGTAAVLGWSADEVKQAIAKLIQAKLFFACDCYITSSKVQRELEHRKSLSESRAKAGSKGGLTRAQNAINSDPSKQLPSKTKQIQANSSRSDQIRSEKIREEKKDQSVCVASEIAGAREGPQLPTATLGGIDPRALVEKLAATQSHSEPVKILAQEVPNGTHPKPPSATTMTRSERFAQNSLSQPDGSQEWERDNLFILAGRRPMKNFPLMWMTPTELKDVVELYDKNGLTPEEVRGAIKSADARLKTGLVNGKPKNTISVFNWLIGWCLQEQLEIANSANKAKRSKSYEQPKYDGRR